MCLTKELNRHINNAHKYYFIDFVKKAYEIIYVDGGEHSKKKMEELQTFYKHYLNNIFPAKVKLVKYAKGGKVCNTDDKFLKDTKYVTALVWKENNKILTDPEEFETWIKEV